jgi:hypothetical protein
VYIGTEPPGAADHSAGQTGLCVRIMFGVIIAWMVLACSTCTVAAITPGSNPETPAAQPEGPAASYKLNRVVLIAGSVVVADSVRQQHPDACYRVTVVLPVTDHTAAHTFDFRLDSTAASSIPLVAQIKLPAALNPLEDAIVHCEQRTNDSKGCCCSLQ